MTLDISSHVLRGMMKEAAQKVGDAITEAVAQASLPKAPGPKVVAFTKGR